MIKIKKPNRSGLGFAEILVAVMITAVCSIPVIYMVTSSRTDTSKAINYLRAVELANEVIEWAQGVTFDDLDDARFSAAVGPLSDHVANDLVPVAIDIVPPENPNWLNPLFTSSDLKYSEQYGAAYFYREVVFEDVPASLYYGTRMLKKMTVRVKWNEGKMPTSVYTSDRDRQVELSVLLLNDANMSY